MVIVETFEYEAHRHYQPTENVEVVIEASVIDGKMERIIRFNFDNVNCWADVCQGVELIAQSKYCEAFFFDPMVDIRVYKNDPFANNDWLTLSNPRELERPSGAQQSIVRFDVACPSGKAMSIFDKMLASPVISKSLGKLKADVYISVPYPPFPATRAREPFLLETDEDVLASAW